MRDGGGNEIGIGGVPYSGKTHFYLRRYPIGGTTVFTESTLLLDANVHTFRLTFDVLANVLTFYIDGNIVYQEASPLGLTDTAKIFSIYSGTDAIYGRRALLAYQGVT